MNKTIRVYASQKEMKAGEYRYWQSRPVHERMSAVAELTRAAYAMKEPGRDLQRLEKLLSASHVARQEIDASQIRVLMGVPS